ncbi:hypothetical protein U1Q18_009779 [Sarracenia purpurea var. burkii]
MSSACAITDPVRVASPVSEARRLQQIGRMAEHGGVTQDVDEFAKNYGIDDLNIGNSLAITEIRQGDLAHQPFSGSVSNFVCAPPMATKDPDLVKYCNSKSLEDGCSKQVGEKVETYGPAHHMLDDKPKSVSKSVKLTTNAHKAVEPSAATQPFGKQSSWEIAANQSVAICPARPVGFDQNVAQANLFAPSADLLLDAEFGFVDM